MIEPIVTKKELGGGNKYKKTPQEKLELKKAKAEHKAWCKQHGRKA